MRSRMHISGAQRISGVKHMKKILLIGDSIRMGYDSYVRESMQNVAEVYYPSVNCAFSTNILRYLHTWTDELKLYEADAVHFNTGLWDTVRIYGDNTLTTPTAYADNMARIAKRIRFLFPEAKIIFATSTPVIESGFIYEFENRFNRDVEEFNRIACEVLIEYGVIINDLYTLLKDVPESFHSDQTHFYTAEATELIGNQVSHVLCEALDINPGALISPDPQKYHYPDRYPGDRDTFVKHGHIYVHK